MRVSGLGGAGSWRRVTRVASARLEGVRVRQSQGGKESLLDYLVEVQNSLFQIPKQIHRK